MDYWSVEVMYYDDGHQAFNTYMVKAQDQNDAINQVKVSLASKEGIVSKNLIPV